MMLYNAQIELLRFVDCQRVEQATTGCCGVPSTRAKTGWIDTGTI